MAPAPYADDLLAEYLTLVRERDGDRSPPAGLLARITDLKDRLVDAEPIDPDEID